jgi:hypothetical protein
MGNENFADFGFWWSLVKQASYYTNFLMGIHDDGVFNVQRTLRLMIMRPVQFQIKKSF